jgi:hypothetical protein
VVRATVPFSSLPTKRITNDCNESDGASRLSLSNKTTSGNRSVLFVLLLLRTVIYSYYYFYFY